MQEERSKGSDYEPNTGLIEQGHSVNSQYQKRGGGGGGTLWSKRDLRMENEPMIAS